MLDKIHMSWDWSLFDQEWARAFQATVHRIQEIDPQTGDIVWDIPAWESMRSDSHRVAVRPGSRALLVRGSPARCWGDGCNVFSGGPVAAEDLLGSAQLMRSVASAAIGHELPDVRLAKVSWVDVTRNFLLPDLADVRQALRELAQTAGGRYRVSQTAGDTVYWAHKSSVRSCKAYAKGPHLLYMNRNPRSPRVYDPTEVTLASRLLRVELSLRRHYWSRLGRPWWEVTPEDLASIYTEWWSRMVGGVSVQAMGGVREAVMRVAPTPGQGRAALATWDSIRLYGTEEARSLRPKATWYRHLAILRAAGLADADLSLGEVLSFRQRLVEVVPVSSWEHLRAAA